MAMAVLKLGVGLSGKFWSMDEFADLLMEYSGIIAWDSQSLGDVVGGKLVFGRFCYHARGCKIYQYTA